MRVLLLIISCFMVVGTFAGEVETQCLAMNENREKIITNVKAKSNTSKGSSRQ